MGGSKYKKEMDECRKAMVTVSSTWSSNVTEPNGDSVNMHDASNAAGQQWSLVGKSKRRKEISVCFCGHVFFYWRFNDLTFLYISSDYIHDDMGEIAGITTQICTRLDEANVWHCKGTFVDPYGCEGQVSFAGLFSDETSEGKYTIVGGTGRFLGATGYIMEHFSMETLESHMTVDLKKNDLHAVDGYQHANKCGDTTLIKKTNGFISHF